MNEALVFGLGGALVVLLLLATAAIKIVNEAYHTLSDAEKKLRYDSRFYWVSEETNYAYWQELKRQRYERWKRSQENKYRFDRNYFRIQGLAFLVFVIIAGFCFGIIHTAHYYVEREYRQKQYANSQLLKKVNGLFGEGKFDDAFNMINGLLEQDPLEYRFGFTRDSLVHALRVLADSEYKAKDFSGAVTHYLVLKNYEHPTRFETLENLSLCQYYLGNYRESLRTMKQLLLQQPDNPVLIYQIGHINLEKLDDPEEALHYFTIGKTSFKENLGKVYGSAFEIVMDPADAPDIYYYIFEGRAITNIKLKNYSDAVTDCNWAIMLRPHQGQPYYLRAEANIRQKAFRYVCDDLNKAVQLGIQHAQTLQRKHCY